MPNPMSETADDSGDLKNGLVAAGMARGVTCSWNFQE